MSESPRAPFEGSVRRKAERMRRSRAAKASLWQTLGRTVGIGWMVVLPLALGAALGHWLAVRFARPGLAIMGLGVGLAVGLYGAYVQVRRLLIREADAPDEPDDPDAAGAPGEEPRDDR